MKTLLFIIALLMLSPAVWGWDIHTLDDDNTGPESNALSLPPLTCPQPQPERKTPRYNPYNGRYQPARQSDQLKYNPYQNQWQYADPDSQLDYNPYDGEWYFDR